MEDFSRYSISNADLRLDASLRAMIRSQQANGLASAGRKVASRGGAAVLVREARKEITVLARLSRDIPDEDLEQIAELSSYFRRVTDEIALVTLPILELRNLASLAEFIEAPQPYSLETSEPSSEPSSDPSVEFADQGTDVPGGKFTGKGVVIAIIDDGFDWAHPDFIDAAGSRIEYFWHQGLHPQGAEHSPAEFGIGVEYTKADIDALLSRNQTGGPSRNAGWHGTHVAGIAASNGGATSGRVIGAAPDARLIFINPRFYKKPTLTESQYLVMAIEYAFLRAKQLGMPCVVNISLGQNGGSHDGVSLVERTIDSMLTREGRAIVVAAGNEQGHRSHHSGHVRVGVPYQLGFCVPSPHSQARIEVWYDSVDVFSAELIDPQGRTCGTVVPNEERDWRYASGTTVRVTSERFSRQNGDSRIQLEITHEDNASGVTPGVWSLVINSTRLVNGRLDAWIERDDREAGYQTVFLDCAERGTLNCPATARSAVAVANFAIAGTQSTPRVYDTSSRGLTRDGRWKPDLAAHGTDIDSSCAGQPEKLCTATGTSMSAPFVAGTVARMLQAQPKLLAPQISKRLHAACTSRGHAPHDVAWGYGQLDPVEAVSLALLYSSK